MKHILTYESYSPDSTALDLDYINSKLKDEKVIKTIKRILDSLSPRIKKSIFNYVTNVKVLNIDKLISYFSLISKSKAAKNKDGLSNNKFIEEVSSELGSKNESLADISIGIIAFTTLLLLCVGALVGAVAMSKVIINRYRTPDEFLPRTIFTIVGLFVVVFLSSFSFWAGAGMYNVATTGNLHCVQPQKSEITTVDVKFQNQTIKLQLTKDEDGNFQVKEVSE